MATRISLVDFSLANPFYIGATVTAYTVDNNGDATTTKATLYDSFSGTGTLANPQTLDSEGKFAAPVYIEDNVVLTVTGLTIPDHSTGVITTLGTWRGTWVTATTYYPGDVLVDGANGNNTLDLYQIVSQHTSGTWATDSVDATLMAQMIDISALEALFTLPATAGNALKLPRANAGGTAYEMVTADAVFTGATSPTLGGDLDMNGHQMQWSKGADVASATALPLLTDGNFFDVTGSVTITSFDTTGGAGTPIMLRFDAAPLLTHHATNLILPGGANIQAAAGDKAIFVEYGTGTYECLSYQVAANMPALQGKQHIWIPAVAMRPTSSNGCASIADLETTAGRPDLSSLDFDATADEHAQFGIAAPKSWNESTVTFQPVWSHAGGQTGGQDGVVWFLQGLAVTNDESADQVFGTQQNSTDDQVTAEDVYFGPESAAITIAGTPAEGDMLFFRVGRDVSEVADDLDIDAKLVGIILYLTTNAGNDA